MAKEIDNDDGRLIIDVGRLARDGEHFRGEIPVEILEYDPEDIIFKPFSGLRYDIFVQLLGTELLVRGKVSEEFDCMCVRCGGEFRWEAFDDEVTFSHEVSADAFDDLTGELRESIVLTFPSNPLCDNDCKGLCTHCGKNLNEGPCGCKHDDGMAWGGLNGLKL